MENLPLPLQYLNSSEDNFTHPHPKLIVANYVQETIVRDVS